MCQKLLSIDSPSIDQSTPCPRLDGITRRVRVRNAVGRASRGPDDPARARRQTLITLLDLVQKWTQGFHYQLLSELLRLSVDKTLKEETLDSMLIAPV